MIHKINIIHSGSSDFTNFFKRGGKSKGPLYDCFWTIGNIDILNRNLLGFFCSVKCPGDIILKTYDLARSFRDAGIPLISGFHSPIEKDVFDLLLSGSQPLVVCPARVYLMPGRRPLITAGCSYCLLSRKNISASPHHFLNSATG